MVAQFEMLTLKTDHTGLQVEILVVDRSRCSPFILKLYLQMLPLQILSILKPEIKEHNIKQITHLKWDKPYSSLEIYYHCVFPLAY